MTNEVALFDYAKLPVSDMNEVRAAAERIRIRMKRTAEDIIEIGRDLLVIQSKVPHGSFLSCIEQEFGMSKSAAYNFMAVCKKFGDKLPKFGSLVPSALQMLISAPAEVITQVEAKVAAGEDISGPN